MGFSSQEYWSWLPFPSLGSLPKPGIKPRSPVLQADSLPSEPPRKLFLFLNCDPLQCLYWKPIFSEVSPLWPIRMPVSQYCLTSWPPGHLTASQYLFPAGPYGVESFVFIALNPWVFIALNPWLPVQISRASFLCHSLFPAIIFNKSSHLSGHIFVHFLLSSSGHKKYTCVLHTCPAICSFFRAKAGAIRYPSITYHKLVHSVSNIWKLLYSFIVVYSKITDLVPVTLSRSKVTPWILKSASTFWVGILHSQKVFFLLLSHLSLLQISLLDMTMIAN